MDVRCDDVLREIANYVDEDIDPALRLEMTRHFGECERCRALLDSMRNVVSLYGNDHMFAPAPDFDRRLHSWLAGHIEGPKGSWWGWMTVIGIAGGAAVLVIALSLHSRIQPRAEMSQPSRQLQEQLVAVNPAGKLYHDPKCPFIHGKYRMVTAEEAVREGYTPCTRCRSDDLKSAWRLNPDTLEQETLAASKLSAQNK